MFCSNGQNTVTERALSLLIDYKQSVDTLIKKGNYVGVDPYIGSTVFVKNEVTPKDTVIQQTAILLNFNQTMTSKNVIDSMKIRGLRPATAQELYSLGMQYPELQREFDIIALGSVTKDARVPVLWESPFYELYDRDADLWIWSALWDQYEWFLAFHD